MCRDGSTGYLKCGQNGHFMRECPKNKQGNGNEGNRAQPSSVAPPGKVASRGATLGASRGGNYLYAITSHQEKEDSLDVSLPVYPNFSSDDLDLAPRATHSAKDARDNFSGKQKKNEKKETKEKNETEEKEEKKETKEKKEEEELTKV
ncbi:protein PXR1-like [Solanum stenotomum]|uniref:protein PXR1-like n=1 Tax=Solanum stenotomum TaxID=172797 RepID=UPI0020D1012E|nr:protein PXR1-like [Solanum stenotomum]